MSKENFKILSPKLDVVFQRLFGEEGSENITKSLLESILDRKIDEIDLSKNPILRRAHVEDKLGILDILVEVDGKEKIDIELQVIKNGDEIERALFYWAKEYAKGINKGDQYIKLKKTIVIMITDFEIERLKELGIHTKWRIMDEMHRIILTDKFEAHIIELPKLKRQENIKDELFDWLMFIENPESERVKRKMGENKNIKEAKEKLDKMSQDERMQKIAEWRQDAIIRENTLFDYGKEQRTIEIAKKMLNEKIDIRIIEKITGLTKEEIEQLEE